MINNEFNMEHQVGDRNNDGWDGKYVPFNQNELHKNLLDSL